jgi:hypothetical protein
MIVYGERLWIVVKSLFPEPQGRFGNRGMGCRGCGFEKILDRLGQPDAGGRS